uniref:Ovule protein n=1 Tax=Meloidogyne incognita TaxID=6306 RepID=A0A914LFU5_MELIC
MNVSPKNCNFKIPRKEFNCHETLWKVYVTCFWTNSDQQMMNIKPGRAIAVFGFLCVLPSSTTRSEEETKLWIKMTKKCDNI